MPTIVWWRCSAGRGSSCTSLLWTDNAEEKQLPTNKQTHTNAHTRTHEYRKRRVLESGEIQAHMLARTHSEWVEPHMREAPRRVVRSESPSKRYRSLCTYVCIFAYVNTTTTYLCQFAVFRSRLKDVLYLMCSRSSQKENLDHFLAFICARTHDNTHKDTQ